jgi:hypothetical protein
MQKVDKLLGSAAKALFIIYAICIIFDSLPVRLTDPSWIYGFATSLVNFSSIPLTAYALLQLAFYLAPSPKLDLTLTRVGKIARFVALGFVLLVPLLGFSLSENTNRMLRSNVAQRRLIQQNLATFTRAIDRSTTPQQLQKEMLALKGPRIADDALGIPLPLLKSQVQASIKQAANTLESNLKSPNSAEFLPFYKQFLRTGFLALASAYGFAKLAWWPSRGDLPLAVILFGTKISLNPTKIKEKLSRAILSLKRSVAEKSRLNASRDASKRSEEIKRKASRDQEMRIKNNQRQAMRKREEMRKREMNQQRKK